MAKLATIAPFGFPDFNPATLLKVYRDLGCHTSQFYRNTNNPPDPADARRIAQDAGLPIDSIHGVFGFEFDPSSPDESVRAAAVEAYRREGELALTLGGPRVVVHPAPMARDPADITPHSRQSRLAPLLRSMEDLAAVGQRQGVVYLFENIPPNYHLGSDPAQLADLIRGLNHPCLKMCFDTGHAFMTGDPAAALDACRDAVAYFHVHDNNGLADSHATPGRGSLPWDSFAAAMARMPAGVPAMLELFQPEPEMKAELANGLPARLRRWLALS